MRDDYYSEYFQLKDRHWWFVGRRHILLSLLDRHFGFRGRRRVAPGARLRLRNRLDVRIPGSDTASPRGWMSSSRRSTSASLGGTQQRFAADGYGELPFEDATFSLVYRGCDVFEHVEGDLDAMREGRPGAEGRTGCCSAAVPAHQWMWGPQGTRSAGTSAVTTPRLLRSRLLEAGFSIERLTYSQHAAVSADRGDQADPTACCRLPRSCARTSGRPRKVSSTRSWSGCSAARARWLARRDLPFGVSLAACGASFADLVGSLAP